MTLGSHPSAGPGICVGPRVEAVFGGCTEIESGSGPCSGSLTGEGSGAGEKSFGTGSDWEFGNGETGSGSGTARSGRFGGLRVRPNGLVMMDAKSGIETRANVNIKRHDACMQLLV